MSLGTSFPRPVGSPRRVVLFGDNFDSIAHLRQKVKNHWRSHNSRLIFTLRRPERHEQLHKYRAHACGHEADVR